jgi:hypothetical protein
MNEEIVNKFDKLIEALENIRQALIDIEFRLNNLK